MRVLRTCGQTSSNAFSWAGIVRVADNLPERPIPIAGLFRQNIRGRAIRLPDARWSIEKHGVDEIYATDSNELIELRGGRWWSNSKINRHCVL